MRITRSDASQLVVLDFPWLIPAIFFPMAGFMSVCALFAIARAINKPNFPWFGTGSGGMWGSTFAALLSGAVAAAFCVRTEFTFDLVARRLTWSRRSLFSAAGGVVPLEQIRYAWTECSSDGDGDTFGVTLKTDAGPLSLSPFFSSGQSRFDRIREAINRALDVRFSDAATTAPDILELVLSGKKRDAVNLARKRYGYDMTQAREFVEGLVS